MSCFVMVRSPLRPFAPARGSFTRHRASFRSMIHGVPPEAGERHCFARIACAQACGCARPFRGGARTARLIARVRPPAPACARRPRERRGRHEMSRSGARSGRFRRSGSFVHGASRLLSFNGPGRPPEPEERHCFARTACARVRACTARAHFAAVRVSRARLPHAPVRATAGQTQDTPIPLAHAGAFAAPQPLLPCAEKPKGDPGSRLSRAHCSTVS